MTYARYACRANSVLKQYLIKGYAVNERIRKQQISELRQLVQVLGRTLQQQPVPTTDESNALFKVVVDYTYALDTLDDYDYQRLSISKTTSKETFHATYENAMKEINVLKKKFGCPVKEKAFEIKTWEDFRSLYSNVQDYEYTYNGRYIEGFVFTDASGFMTKCKTAYYNEWKKLRCPDSLSKETGS